MVNTPIEVYAAVFASADRSDIGAGVKLFFTEKEALDCIREDLIATLDGRWDDGNYDSQEEADREYEATVDNIQKMTYHELQSAYAEDSGDDWLQVVYVEKHTLAPPPDVSTPDKIEQFLGVSDVG